MGIYKTADDHAADRAVAKARKRRGRGAKVERMEEVKAIPLGLAGQINRQRIAEQERKQREFEEGFKRIQEANEAFANEFIASVRKLGSGYLLKDRKGFYFIRGLVKNAFRHTDYFWNEDAGGLKVALRKKA